MTTSYEEAKVITENIVKTIRKLHGTSKEFRQYCAVAFGPRLIHPDHCLQSERGLSVLPGLQGNAAGTNKPGRAEQ